MSDLSNYAETKLYDHAMGRASWTMPTVYLALFTAVTDAEAGTGTEVSASGYARQAVTMGASTDGAGANSATVTVGPLAGTGTATYAALMDAVSAGNPITVIKALTASKTWSAGDSIQFAAGQITFQMA